MFLGELANNDILLDLDHIDIFRGIFTHISGNLAAKSAPTWKFQGYLVEEIRMTLIDINLAYRHLFKLPVD